MMANKIRRTNKQSNLYIYLIMIVTILFMAIFLVIIWNKGWNDVFSRIFIGFMVILVGFVVLIINSLRRDKDIAMHKRMDIFGAMMFGFPIFPIFWDKTLYSITSIIIFVCFIVMGISIILGLLS